MSKPTSAVKDRWNKANYDQLNIRLPKGKKAELQKAAEAAVILLLTVYHFQLQNKLKIRSL